jgi:hypothetical protein
MQIIYPEQEDISTRRCHKYYKIEIRDIKIAKWFRVLLDNREGR